MSKVVVCSHVYMMYSVPGFKNSSGEFYPILANNQPITNKNNAHFPAHGTGCVFSRARHRLCVFPRSAQVACFPALGTGCVFSRAQHRLRVFPRSAQVVCFPALGTGCVFSRARHRLRVLPRSAQAGLAFSYFRHRLRVFPCLKTASRYNYTWNFHFQICSSLQNQFN